MERHARSKRGPVLAGVALAVAALTAVVLAVRAPGPSSAPPEVASAPAPRALPAATPVAPPPAPAPVGVSTTPAPVTVPFAPAPEPADPGAGRYPIDLEALRRKLPDNLYWQVGVATSDPEVAKKRAEDAKRWNDLYGKVLSGTASEEEIRKYYDYRRKVSEDYIQFSKQVLADYGGELPERDRGLYELALQMHQTRLNELPRQIEDSLALKRAQDQRRDEWVRSGKPQ